MKTESGTQPADAMRCARRAEGAPKTACSWRARAAGLVGAVTAAGGAAPLRKSAGGGCNEDPEEGGAAGTTTTAAEAPAAAALPAAAEDGGIAPASTGGSAAASDGLNVAGESARERSESSRDLPSAPPLRPRPIANEAGGEPFPSDEAGAEKKDARKDDDEDENGTPPAVFGAAPESLRPDAPPPGPASDAERASIDCAVALSGESGEWGITAVGLGAVEKGAPGPVANALAADEKMERRSAPPVRAASPPTAAVSPAATFGAAGGATPTGDASGEEKAASGAAAVSLRKETSPPIAPARAPAAAAGGDMKPSCPDVDDWDASIKSHSGEAA